MTISPELRHAFNFHRAKAVGNVYPKPRGQYLNPAQEALKNARVDFVNGVSRFTSSPWRKPVTNPRFPAEGRNAGQMQWIEKPASMGLRFVGYADDLASIGHTGWYTDLDCFESIRGVVYQLPGRNGRARFVAGHDNRDNGAADDGGPALIDWSTIYESDFEQGLAAARRMIGASYWTPAMDSPGYWARAAHKTARKDAARGADSFAESQAEDEREYQTAWRAGSNWADEKGEIAFSRATIKALLTERRQAMANAESYPAICATIRGVITTALADIAESRRKMGELASGDFDDLIFYPDERLRAAFNDGAGEAVI